MVGGEGRKRYRDNFCSYDILIQINVRKKLSDYVTSLALSLGTPPSSGNCTLLLLFYLSKLHFTGSSCLWVSFFVIVRQRSYAQTQHIIAYFVCWLGIWYFIRRASKTEQPSISLLYLPDVLCFFHDRADFIHSDSGTQSVLEAMK
jgi:hypothetical protein